MSHFLRVYMVLAVAVVAALAYFDSRREASAALNDLAQDQSALARSFAEQATTLPEPRSADAIFATVPHVERAGETIVLLSAPGSGQWTTRAGTVLRSAALDGANDGGLVFVSRDDARALGLPARTAVAGIASTAGAAGAWKLAVATSAIRQRDREKGAQLRLVSSVLLAAGLVVAFGGVGLRQQRRELELKRKLDLADAQRDLDERLLRADKLATMGALAIGVAHEIATPLGVITGRAELLKQKADDPRAKRNVEEILEQCERIDRVIRGLLGMARGDTPILERVEPRAIGAKATDLVAHRFAAAGVELATTCASDLPLVACDARLVEQALANLLLNARDACRAGSGHVDLSIEGDARHVSFVVTDNGKGIAPDAIARVFEPFFTTKPVGEGTGLGLSIANEIVKHNRGKLTISPRHEGRPVATMGTRACIEMPAVPRSDA